jgi:cation-transporting ATPase 13A2
MSDQLVPGDLVKVPEGLVLPCDMVLLSGSAIVNESILTGESIPVIKSYLPSTQDKYLVAECGKHTLFGGTSVIQTRP